MKYKNNQEVHVHLSVPKSQFFALQSGKSMGLLELKLSEQPKK